MAGINPSEVYTTEETRQLLKVSASTMKRLIKKGLIRANKIGKQYRIMGHEILQLLSPQADVKMTDVYQGVKKKVVEKTNNW